MATKALRRRGPRERLRWRRGVVSVDGPAGRFDEEATICRGLAVHALPSRGPMLACSFRVTHVKSGRSIMPIFNRRAAAMAWARRLLALGDWTGDAATVKHLARRVHRLRDTVAENGATP